MKMRWIFYFPMVILIVITFYLLEGLEKKPMVLESVLINKKVPTFSLPPIQGRNNGISNTDLEKQIVLVNIFGSWCISCKAEHAFLMRLKENDVIPILGINWREPNRSAGPNWLKKLGNPYVLVGDDPKSIGAMAFGVTGAPETFIIDDSGFIRFKHAGPINKEIWQNSFEPIIDSLRKK